MIDKAVCEAIDRCKDLLDPAVMVDVENMPAACVADLLTIVRAGYATAADDGEPVDAEFLQSVGFFESAPYGHPEMHRQTHSGPRIIRTATDDWMYGNLPLQRATTRGHVRRLLAALSPEVPRGPDPAG